VLASYLDSTNLKPEATENSIRMLCEEALGYEMAAVCIHPCHLALAHEILANSSVKLCTVIGFPLGAELLSAKVYSAREALYNGAAELDMVINIGAVKDKAFRKIYKEIQNILLLKNEYQFTLKVIVETALLDELELAYLTEIISETKADFIKTSTGFSSRGVSMQDIKIIKAHKNEELNIKASGGVKNLDFALELIQAGVDRIGSSNAGYLVEEFIKRGGL
jgi:deoxyribose-phosphate aldolase